MKFTLKTPCKDCPFRTDVPGYLSSTRARGIARNAQTGAATFACHKTVKHDEDGEQVRSDGEIHCAGALIMAEKLNKGRSGGPGCHVNQLVRIASRFSGFNADELDVEAPVFDSVEAMAKHHGKGSAR